ncbi:TonB-dependent receptor [Sphingobium sp. HWE2-09]|uniref:TonB-dependent receptor n=1 Tax=Sphingobium sp. HWE2-09 TaxID=3108390 RepID=UPI002DC31FA2|nr:TonB-dependent receptor [Sphingobium sp. HWE2-09]
MKREIKLTLLASAFSFCLTGAAHLAAEVPSASPGDPAATDDNSGGDIVVTASKRDQKLRDVPAAITAVTSEKLEALGIASMRDYQAFVPGFSQRDNGTAGFGAVILRGMNTGPQQNTATAAFYLDEAGTTTSAFSGSGAFVNPDVDLTDVARIEVLKGPQGTLYGANNIGGLVRVISVEPDSTEFSGNARGEVNAIHGGNMGYLIKNSINAPLVADKLALRITGSYANKAGWTDNVGTGKKNANTGEAYGVRAALLATPTPELKISLWGLYQKVIADGYTQQDNLTNSTTPIYGRDKYNSYYEPGNRTNYKIASGTVDYDLGGVTSVTNVSYVKQHTNLDIDYTGVYVPILPRLGVPLPANTGVPAKFFSDLKKWTADSQLVSERIGSFEFIVGGFYSHDDLDFRPTIALANKLTGQPLPVPYAVGLIAQRTLDLYKEYAAYGNVTFYFTDNLDAQGGIRYSHNSQDITSTRVGLLAGLQTPKTDSFHFSDNVATYLATLRWRPTQKISAYIRAASGYRPGGPLTTASPPASIPKTINPDTVWNYEAGIKASVLDNKVDVAATVFHVDWKNVQLQGLANGLQYQTNGGSADIDGLEFELSARPLDGLRLSFTSGYTNARLKRVDPAVSASIFAFSGDRFPLTPRWTASSTADYDFPLSDEVKGTVGASLRYQSKNPTSFAADPANNNLLLDSITTVDLRAGVNFGSVTAQARIDNVFNKRALVASTDRRPVGLPGVATPVWAIPNRPQMFSLSLSVAY